LGGTLDGLSFAERWLAAQHPHALVRRLPVAGAWHSALLAPAVAPLHAALAARSLHAARCPVIDNTSGAWLPVEAGQRADAIARQVAQPVLWQQGVRTLVAAGATRIVETGWGDMLTHFGFFIDRSARHEAMASLPRTA
jgi:[acyl-carrier-protein] S-malonyltransferase